MEYVFNSLSQRFFDKNGYYPAVLGASDAVANDDPIVVKDRGVLFDGVDDIVIIDEAGSVKLNPTFSLFFWVRYTAYGK